MTIVSSISAVASSRFPGAGYIGGGQTIAPPSVQKWDFYNDTKTTLGSNMITSGTQLWSGGSVTGNGRSWMLGGYNGSARVTTCQRFDHATETFTTISGVIPVATYLANQSGYVIPEGTRGYMSGGSRSGPTSTNAIQKIEFATETVSTLSATISVSNDSIATFCSYAFGYNSGGGSNWTSATDKVAFATDTKSATTGQGVNRAAQVGANSDARGYVQAGTDGTSYQNQYRRLSFSNDTWTLLAAVTTNAKSRGSGFHSVWKSYIVGGWANPTVYSNIDMLTYSTETKSSITGGVATLDMFGWSRPQ